MSHRRGAAPKAMKPARSCSDETANTSSQSDFPLGAWLLIHWHEEESKGAGRFVVKTRWSAALLCLVVLAISLFADDQGDVEKAQQEKEAKRVEREFAAGRQAAYKLVRSDDPKLSAALDQLRKLLELVEKDTSLDEKRREVLIVTLKYDLEGSGRSPRSGDSARKRGRPRSAGRKPTRRRRRRPRSGSSI